MKNIYLVGFMGSGKSTIGKMLAEKLNMRFVDIDKEVEKSQSLQIKDIFAKFGEKYFRDLEKSKLKEYIGKTGYVVSTGGGLGADRQMMELMKQNGKVVWINASLDTILERCKNDTDRPLLKLPFDDLSNLFEKRKEVYSLADIVINSDDSQPMQVVQNIVCELKI